MGAACFASTEHLLLMSLQKLRCAGESPRVQLGSPANLAISLTQERNSAPINSVRYAAVADAPEDAPRRLKDGRVVYLKAVASDWPCQNARTNRGLSKSACENRLQQLRRVSVRVKRPLKTL